MNFKQIFFLFGSAHWRCLWEIVVTFGKKLESAKIPIMCSLFRFGFRILSPSTTSSCPVSTSEVHAISLTGIPIFCPFRERLYRFRNGSCMSSQRKEMFDSKLSSHPGRMWNRQKSWIVRIVLLYRVLRTFPYPPLTAARFWWLGFVVKQNVRPAFYSVSVLQFYRSSLCPGVNPRSKKFCFPNELSNKFAEVLSLPHHEDSFAMALKMEKPIINFFLVWQSGSLTQPPAFGHAKSHETTRYYGGPTVNVSDTKNFPFSHFDLSIHNLFVRRVW